MINVPYSLELSQCSQRLFQSERWWTFQGYYFLFPDCRFQCRCRFLGCLQLQRHSQKPHPLPPDFQYPMNSPHYYSRSRKYFLHFGSLFPFLLNRLATFCSRLNLYRFLIMGGNTYSTSLAMFVTGIIRLFRSNCPRGVQKRISLEAAILCSKSEACFSYTTRER